MFWLLNLIIIIVAALVAALLGLLGPSAKRASRKVMRKLWGGFKKHTRDRWSARRDVSRGKKPKRHPRVLKSQPVIYRFQEKTYEPTIPLCGHETAKGTSCKLPRMQTKSGAILDHCWMHPPRKASAQR